jgi:hypothetical protein
MQGQPNETVAEGVRRTERTILTLLLSDGQCVWSVEELVARTSGAGLKRSTRWPR